MKKIRLIIKLAVVGIITNKVRSILTVLGIVIGIAAVIALLALGQGAQLAISNSINSLGSNLIGIIPGTTFRGPPGTSTNAEIGQREYDYINSATRFPTVSAASPVITDFATLRGAEENIFAEVNGVNSNFTEIQSLELEQGRFFREADVAASKNVAVIGPDVAAELLPEIQSDEILGQELIIKNIPFRVVGLLKSRGSAGFSNQDLEVYIPYSTASTKVFNRDNFSQILISVNDAKLSDATVIQLEEKLSAFKGLELEDKDFTVYTSDDILATASTVTSIFTTLLASIAAISLIVGGIGISNIMLVSVTERTREIGLRKAIGAREGDILSQFLLESVMLTVLGGFIGIALGVLLAFGVGQLAGIQAQISFDIVALATSISAIVGVVFGYFPALKAAKLDPITALRFE
jgi:putative ABC transport system permease protein